MQLLHKSTPPRLAAAALFSLEALLLTETPPSPSNQPQGLPVKVIPPAITENVSSRLSSSIPSSTSRGDPSAHAVSAQPHFQDNEPEPPAHPDYVVHLENDVIADSLMELLLHLIADFRGSSSGLGLCLSLRCLLVRVCDVILHL
jgi:hypothetical protein